MTVLAAIPDLAELNRMIARFAPAEIRADASHLAPGDQKALQKLIEAARVIDDLFITQLWSGNAALREKLAQDTIASGPGADALLQYEQGPVVGSGRPRGISSRRSRRRNLPGRISIPRI